MPVPNVGPLDCFQQVRKLRRPGRQARIIVEIPEYSISMENHEFYISRKIVLAQLKLRLSAGLFIKILNVIEDDADGECDNPLKPGDYKPFRRTRCKWRLA